MQPVNFVSVNYSLQRFGNAITALVLSGAGIALIGLVLMMANSTNPSGFLWATLGALFIYLGSGLIGLGIFGAFLKITAKAIIEGLGGSISESADTYAGNAFAGVPASHTPDRSMATEKPGAQTEPASAPRNSASSVDSWQHLSGREYKAWVAAGSPKLDSWDAADRPDFMTWLKDQA